MYNSFVWGETNPTIMVHFMRTLSAGTSLVKRPLSLRHLSNQIQWILAIDSSLWWSIITMKADRLILDFRTSEIDWKVKKFSCHLDIVVCGTPSIIWLFFSSISMFPKSQEDRVPRLKPQFISLGFGLCRHSSIP